MNLSPDLLQRLRVTLKHCNAFKSNANLHSIFIDARIAPWRDCVPDVDTPIERINRLIAVLYDKTDTKGENALVLFLRVLAEQTPPGDRCHYDLVALANELSALPPKPSNIPNISDTLPKQLHQRQVIFYGALALTVVVIGVLLLTGWLVIAPPSTPTSTVTPTPLAFPPAGEGESLIIVADFKLYEGSVCRHTDPAQHAFGLLKEQLQSNTRVRVERLYQMADDSTVRSIGEAYTATLLLWGWCDEAGLTPCLENIRRRTKVLEGNPILIPDQQLGTIITFQNPAKSAYLVHFTLGVEALAQDKYREALGYFYNALDQISPDMNIDDINPAKVLVYISIIHSYLGEYEKAWEHLEEARQWANNEDDTKLQAFAQFGLGQMYYQQGKYQQALVELELAVSSWGYSSQDELVITYMLIAQTCQMLNECGSENMLGYYQKALDVPPTSDLLKAWTLEMKGKAHLIEASTKVRQIREASTGDKLVSIEDYGIAEKDFLDALDLAKELGAKELEAAILNNLGHLYYDQKLFRQALQHWEGAMELWEGGAWQDDLVCILADTYNSMSRVYSELGDTEKALSCEQKASVLLANSSLQLEQNPDSIPNLDYPDEQPAKRWVGTQ